LTRHSASTTGATKVAPTDPAFDWAGRAGVSKARTAAPASTDTDSIGEYETVPLTSAS